MSKKRSKKVQLLHLAILPVAAMALFSKPTFADDYLYTPGSANTFILAGSLTSCWYDGLDFFNRPPSDGASVAIIGNAGVDIAPATNDNVIFNAFYSGTLGIGSLYLDEGNSISQTDGTTLLLAGSEFLGDNGTGIYTQSAGSNTVTTLLALGTNSGYQSPGVYTLSGGTLTANSGAEEIVGFADNTGGSFTQSGGTNTINGDLILGGNSGSMGVYTLSIGTLNATFEQVAELGSGELDQFSGTNMTSTLMLGTSSGAGTYQLVGGTLQGGGFNVGSNGTYIQTGGVLTYTTLSQTGGSTNFASGLNIGTGETCTLSGGSMSAGTIAVSGSGSLTQSGGSLLFGAINQTGGTVNLPAGVNMTGSGYTLSGGTFTTSSVSGPASNFHFSGGGSLVMTSQTIDVTNTTDPNFTGLILGSAFTLGNGMSLTHTAAGADNWEYIFGSGSSLTQQTGSTNTTPTLIMGATGTSASPVQYTMTGGSLTVSTIAEIGHVGVYTGPAGANFTQSGGNASFNTVQLGEKGPATASFSGGTTAMTGLTLFSGGVVNVSTGGSLSIGSVTLNGGSTSNIHWTGGTFGLTNQYLDVTNGTDPTNNGLILTNGLTLNSGMSLNMISTSPGEQIFGNGSVITQNTGSNNSTPFLSLGSTGTTGTIAPVSYALTGGSLNVSGTADVGLELYAGPASAIFAQSGGTSSFSALILGLGGGSDTCSLSVGTMTVGSTIIQVGGTFHQSGGTLTFPSYNQSGGTSFFDKGLNLTSSTFTLSAGSLTTSTLSGSSSNLKWTGGTVTLSSQAFDVTNATSDPDLGGFIWGNSLTLGSGMSLAVSTLTEFQFGSGSTITQNTGSTNTAAQLIMGDTGTGTLTPAHYNLAGGTLTVSGAAQIGYNSLYTGPGQATLTQSGGTATIGTLYLGLFGGSGTYALSSGSLTVSSNSGAEAASGSTFQQTGGSWTTPQFANGGTITQTGGTASLGGVTGTGSISVGGGSVAASTTVTNLTQSSLSIGNNGTFTIQSNSNSANKVTTLSVTGSGKLDLMNNHLFINYGAGTDPASSVLAALASGSDAGRWDGAGIMSSTANFNETNYGIAYSDGKDGLVSGLSSGQIEVAYALLGDIHMNGVVNGLDFTILAQHFGTFVTGGWEQGDLNYDGVVNGADFSDLARNFGQTESGASVALPASDWAALDSFAAANGLLADVPEPCSVGLLAAGSIGLLRKRQRRTS